MTDKSLFLFWALALVLLAATPCLAQNPFLSPANGSSKEKTVAGSPAPSNPNALLIKLNTLQREFRETMTGYARQIKESPSGRTTWQFLALTFTFGVVHALGPGHGKSIVCAYFLARRGTLRQALLFGNLITLLHVFSAVALVFSLSFLGRQTNILAFQELEGGLQNFSYLLIIAIGTFLLFRAAKDVFRYKHDPVQQNCATADGSSMAALSLSAGLIPCPGAALILLFTLSLDILWAGLAAMVALATGMGLTNSLVGVLTLSSRNAIMSLSSTSPKLSRVTYSLLAISGALFIVFLGTSLLLGSMGSGSV